MTRSSAHRAALAAGVAALTIAGPHAAAQVVPEISPGRSGRITGISDVSIPGVGKPGTLVLPGVRTTLEVGDNLGRHPSGQEKSGSRLIVSPYIQASTANARVQGMLRYQLRAQHSTVDTADVSGLRHSLSARGNALLLGDWLGVQGWANNFFTSTSPFGVLDDDPESSRANSTRVSTVSLSPYLHGRLGSFANYQAQYTLTRTDTSGGTRNLLARDNQQLRATLTSGPSFTRWGWALSAAGSQREYRNGLNFSSSAFTGTLYYVFSPELRVGLSASHLYIEQLTDTRGENRGWGQGINVDWAPNRRTSLRLNLSEQYYGTSADLSFAHRSSRWTFGFNYNRDVYSSNNAGILSMNLGTLLGADAYAPALNPIFQELVDQGVISADDVVIGAGLLNDALVRRHTARATVGYLLPRGALALSLFRDVRSTVLDSTLFLPASDPLQTTAFGRFEARGILLSLGMPLDSASTLSLAGSARDVESLDRPEGARLSTLTARLSTRLDAKTTVSAGVRRTVQSGAEGSVSAYDNNMVFGIVDVRF